MKRRFDTKVMESWVQSVGGIKEAARKISEALECSDSKARKMAGGRYPSLPMATEQEALAMLLNRSRDVVFPPVQGHRNRAS